MRNTLKVLSMFVSFGMVLILAGCGDSSSPSGQASQANQKSLRLAFYADIVTVDPDVFYDIEGAALTQSVYDGLLRYSPDSADLEGALAADWDVSADGLTYTFNLRDAKFSDGTPVTSEAVKKSFERRTQVDQGPAYMLAQVQEYKTPSPQQFIVQLKRPQSDFLDLLASMWGPKVINPSVFEKNAEDNAQEYLKTHASGTGPFELTEFKPGTGYKLTRNPEYWGEQPFFETVDISIQPSVSTQQLQLQRGDLDAILHGVPVSSISSLSSTDGVAVENFDSLGTLTLAFNQDGEALADRAVRQAVIDGIDVPSLVSDVYGDTAAPMVSSYPAPLLPEGMSPISYSSDPSAAKANFPGGLELTLVYTPDSSGVQRRIADLIRQRLAKLGVTVKEQQVELATIYGYRDNMDSAPDLYLSTPTPDAAAPDAWARIVWYTKGGLNFFNYSNPEVDKAIDAGAVATSLEEAQKHYARAGDLAMEDLTEVPIAQVDDVMALSASLTGVEHSPAYPWTLNLGALERK